MLTEIRWANLMVLKTCLLLCSFDALVWLIASGLPCLVISGVICLPDEPDSVEVLANDVRLLDVDASFGSLESLSATRRGGHRRIVEIGSAHRFLPCPALPFAMG